MVVDVDAFALQNAYEANYGIDARRVVALVNVGASAVNINIVSGGQSVFTRDVSIGGNAFTEAVQKELGLPFEGAEDAKKGIPVDGVRFEDVRPVLRAVTDNVLLEVEKTFDFYKATSASDRIDRVVLSGGASLVEGFDEAVRERLDTEVERFDPFRQVALDAAKLQAGAVEDLAPVCAVARRPGAAQGRRPMIRVNLLPGERRKAKAPAFGLQAAQKIALGGSLILLLAGAVRAAGATGRSARTPPRSSATSRPQRREEQRLDAGDLRGARFRGAPRAAAAARQPDRGAAPRPDRAGPHARSGQPALPDMMWLTKMTQTGYDVTMEGNCLSLTSLSDFVANLENSRYFARPVEIVTSEVVAATATDARAHQFTVKGTFQMAGLQPPPPPAAATPPKKGGARG